MPPAFSIYLDLLRFVAAVAVFLDHLTSYPFTDNSSGKREGLAHLLGSHGATAVMLFFVLSGYVIAHVVATRETSAAAYATSRLSRLYSVVLPALVLTLLLDSFGQWLQPDLYAIRKVLWEPPSLEGYGAGLLFVTEWQVFDWGGLVPGSNGPWWSLSFEATYYLLAGLMLFARRWVAVLAGLVILLLAGRTITALLPIWVLGFWLYHARGRLVAAMPAPRAALALSGVLLPMLPFLVEPLGFDNFGVRFDWGRGPFNRNLLLDYAAAMVFAIHLVAALAVCRDAPGPSPRVTGAVRWLGAMTFPLYAMHFPLLCFFAAIAPFDREAPGTMLYVTASTIAVVTLLLPLCDALNRRLRSWGVTAVAAAPR